MTQLSNYPMYSVTKDGEVYSMVNNAGNRRNKPYKLTKCIDRDGYHIIGLHRKTKKVHRLVAETFMPNPDNLPQVNHIDGVKTNNNVSNLKWCTAAENKQHAYTMSITVSLKGEEHHNSKLTDEQTKELIQMTLDGKSNEEIAGKFGLHSRYVSLIRHQKRQQHIWSKHFPGIQPVISNKIVNSKNIETIKEIVRQAFETTKSNTEIGREFNIDASTISRIRNNNKPTAYYKPYMKKYLNMENLQRLSKTHHNDESK